MLFGFEGASIGAVVADQRLHRRAASGASSHVRRLLRVAIEPPVHVAASIQHGQESPPRPAAWSRRTIAVRLDFDAGKHNDILGIGHVESIGLWLASALTASWRHHVAQKLQIVCESAPDSASALSTRAWSSSARLSSLTDGRLTRTFHAAA